MKIKKDKKKSKINDLDLTLRKMTSKELEEIRGDGGHGWVWSWGSLNNEIFDL